MAKANRYNVRCTVCNEVFQNDYVLRHTKSKHKDAYGSGHIVPTTIVFEDTSQRQRTMDSFMSTCATASKKRRVDKEQSPEHKAEMTELEVSEAIEFSGEQRTGKLYIMD